MKSDLLLVGSREMPDSSPLQVAAMLPWAGMHPGKGEHAQMSPTPLPAPRKRTIIIIQ